MENEKSNMLSILMVTLLKGVLYRDNNPALWQSLTTLYAQVSEQGAILGLECIADENEGYAYFKQKTAGEEDPDIPRLVQRRQLSYAASLLCVLLRKKLVEADAGGDASRVILTREQIIDMTRLYMPDTTNEVKMIDQIDTALRRIIEIGFVRTLDGQKDTYEVKRILRAFVDADWISSLDGKLKEYMEYKNDSRE